MCVFYYGVQLSTHLDQKLFTTCLSTSSRRLLFVPIQIPARPVMRERRTPSVPQVEVALPSETYAKLGNPGGRTRFGPGGLPGASRSCNVGFHCFLPWSPFTLTCSPSVSSNGRSGPPDKRTSGRASGRALAPTTSERYQHLHVGVTWLEASAHYYSTVLYFGRY